MFRRGSARKRMLRFDPPRDPQKAPLGVWSKNGALAHGGQEAWEVVSGSRRSGGMFHDGVIQEWGGEQLPTSRKRGR